MSAPAVMACMAETVMPRKTAVASVFLPAIPPTPRRLSQCSLGYTAREATDRTIHLGREAPREPPRRFRIAAPKAMENWQTSAA